MESKGLNIFVGMLIGAVVGYVAGQIIADIVAPEYYTDEELEEMLNELDEIAEKAGYKELKPAHNIKVNKGNAMPKKNYADIFNGENKPELASLVKKYNDPDYVEDDETTTDDIGGGGGDEDTEIITYADYLEQIEDEEIYIMSKEDFEENVSGFKQITLNYYPEDDVLTYDNDTPVQSIEKVLGTEALINFGLFSDDPDIVYVANPKFKGEYEVVRQNGSYEEIVLGKPGKKAAKKVKEEESILPETEHHNVFEDAAKEADGKD